MSADLCARPGVILAKMKTAVAGLLVAAVLAIGTTAPQAQPRTTAKAKNAAPKTPKTAAPAPKAAAPAPPRADRAVPFAVGERLSFDVSWSSYLTAGAATITVAEKKPSYDSTAYYIVAEARPSALLSKLYTLYYKADTLLDSRTLLPQRGSIYSEEGKRHRFRITEFQRAQKRVLFEYRTETSMKIEVPVSPVAQDVLSAIYVVRAIPLKTGDHMTMPISDDGVNYEAQLTVGPQELVKVPLGQVMAWKVGLVVLDAKKQPVGKNMAIWISADARKLPLKLQAEVAVGSVVLTLREATAA